MTQLNDLLGANPQCCLTLAIELASRRLIALETLADVRSTLGKDRALAVLDAARSKFAGDPTAFGEFANALKKEPILSTLADKMQREVDSQGSEGNVTSECTASREGGEKSSGYSTCKSQAFCWSYFQTFRLLKCAAFHLKQVWY